jgi:hypothetical protein
VPGELLVERPQLLIDGDKSTIHLLFQRRKSVIHPQLETGDRLTKTVHHFRMLRDPSFKGTYALVENRHNLLLPFRPVTNDRARKSRDRADRNRPEFRDVWRRD